MKYGSCFGFVLFLLTPRLAAAAPPKPAPAPAPPPAAPAPATQPQIVVMPATDPPPRRAPDPALAEGWPEGLGFLVSLPNPIEGQGWLTGYRGLGLGLFQGLGPTLGLRFGADVSRTADPYFLTTVDQEADDGTITTGVLFENRYGGPTSTFGLDLDIDAVTRLSTAAVAPYVGGGLNLGFRDATVRYVDTFTTSDVTVDVDKHARETRLGLRGLVGAEWRIHRSFALFAEYGLGVNVVSLRTGSGYEKTTNGAGDDDITTTQRFASRQAVLFDLGAGLQQGASLGVLVVF